MSEPPHKPGTTSVTLAWADPQREAAFHRWLDGLAAVHGLVPESLRIASADARFQEHVAARLGQIVRLRILEPVSADRTPCTGATVWAAGSHPPPDWHRPRQQIDEEVVEACVVEAPDDACFLEVPRGRRLLVSERAAIAGAPRDVDIDPALDDIGGV